MAGIAQQLHSQELETLKIGICNQISTTQSVAVFTYPEARSAAPFNQSEDTQCYGLLKAKDLKWQ